MNTFLKVVTKSSLRWCQDSNRVLVVDEQTGTAVSLTGLNEAIWKWCTLAYTYEDVLRLSQVYLNLPQAETRNQLNQILYDWMELGLLVEEKG